MRIALTFPDVEIEADVPAILDDEASSPVFSFEFQSVPLRPPSPAASCLAGLIFFRFGLTMKLSMKTAYGCTNIPIAIAKTTIRHLLHALLLSTISTGSSVSRTTSTRTEGELSLPLGIRQPELAAARCKAYQYLGDRPLGRDCQRGDTR
jgi:hypothetical protein